MDINKTRHTANMNFDQIIVIDIESTCWEEHRPDDTSEIIEIGICSISTKSGNILRSRSVIVKPEHSKVSEFCTRLTTLTQKDVDSGISFKDACDILTKEYCSKKYMWASYGYFDKKQFIAQCEREDVEYPFSKAHINVKLLFALKYSLIKDVGMVKALKLLNMPLVGTHHRGIDDAKNVAKILSKILFDKCDDM